MKDSRTRRTARRASARAWLGAAFCLTFAVAVLGVGVAHGQGQQLYFVGTNAPLGSISSDQATTDAVYLRWDVTEGDLPTDILQFRIERDAAPLVTMSATTVMPASQIQSLYQNAGQNRRLVEMVRWLDELLAQSEPPQGPVTTANFGTELRNTIDPASPTFNEFFAVFGSRIDFNIAIARRRGFLDFGVPAGPHTYTLYAGDGMTEVQVGDVVVNVAAGVHQPLPAAEEFAPVLLARCDAPEQSKDHGVVHLTWRSPGLLGAPEPNNQFASSLMTAGWDLYRTDTTIAGPPPTLDIRALAAGIVHDANGNVAIPGIVKVNDQPIVVSGSPAKEVRYQSFNAPYFQGRDSAEALLAAGFQPGDQIGYYVVARDFTGNLGVTIATNKAVTIPDTRPPPAPWTLRTAQKTYGSEEFSLVWDHVDVRNYYSDYQLARTYCNLETARFDLELTYVAPGEDCETELNREVQLDIADYLIYRFDTFEAARKFVDTDGDGVSDADERVASGALAFPEYSEPGTACDATLQPGGATNYLIDTILSSSIYASLRASGRQVIEYPDVTAGAPIFNKSEVFWYRVASRTPSGVVSELSAPRRARARDREMPLLSDAPSNVGLMARDCTYLAGRPTTIPDPHFAIDATAYEVAHTARAECTEPGDGGTVSFDAPIEDDGTTRGAELSAPDCATLTSLCAGSVDATVSFFDVTGALLDSAAYSSFGSCPIDTTTLAGDCPERPVIPGETLPGPPVLNFPAINDCYYIYQEINGKSYKIHTICPGDPPPTFKFPALSDEICLSWALADDNSSVSTKKLLPCFKLFVLTVGAPQAVEFAFTTGTADATLSFVPPARPVTGTILEWYQKGAEGRSRTFQEHALYSASDGLRMTEIVLTPPPADIEEWCFRARSVAHTGALSPWSTVKCGLRLPPGEQVTDYLPWPKIRVPIKVIPDLDAEYLSDDGRAVVLLSNPITPQNCDITLNACDGTLGGGQCFSPPDFRLECEDLCSTIQSGLNAPLNFVVYRQSKSGATATPSDFQQVSPAIDFIQCEHVLDTFWATEDPFIKPAEFLPAHPWAGTRMVFLDRFPHLGGQWYRYQFVYLTPRGEISRYRNTDWIEAN